LEDMINQTLGHELAHLVAYKVYGSWGHDWKWRTVMRALGLDPSRCHSYSLEGVKTRNVRKVMAKCPTCGKEFPVTLRRAAQIRGGLNIFHADSRCRYVRAALTLVGEEPVPQRPVDLLASVLA
jgi:SprT protein